MIIIFKIFLFSETPKPSQHCPRQNGYFAHEDGHICDKFYYCVDGKYNAITCPAGLVYNENTGICTWPDEAKKKHCSSQGMPRVFFSLLHSQHVCDRKCLTFFKDDTMTHTRSLFIPPKLGLSHNTAVLRNNAARAFRPCHTSFNKDEFILKILNFFL